MDARSDWETWYQSGSFRLRTSESGAKEGAEEGAGEGAGEVAWEGAGEVAWEGAEEGAGEGTEGSAEADADPPRASTSSRVANSPVAVSWLSVTSSPSRPPGRSVPARPPACPPVSYGRKLRLRPCHTSS